jgi:hypothetical protein
MNKRKIEEILKDLKESKDTTFNSVLHNAVKESYNLGLQDAADNAECETGAIVDLGFEIISAIVDKESILKLKL